MGPEISDKLFLPELNRLSARYGGIGIHCCAHAVHQWDGLAHAEGLRVLNLNQSAPVITKALPRFAGVAAQLPIPSPVAVPDSTMADAATWETAWGLRSTGQAILVSSSPSQQRVRTRRR